MQLMVIRQATFLFWSYKQKHPVFIGQICKQRKLTNQRRVFRNPTESDFMILCYWIRKETQYWKGLVSIIRVINNFVKPYSYLSFLFLEQREKVRKTLDKLRLKLQNSTDEEKITSLKKKIKKVNYLDIFSPLLLQIMCDSNEWCTTTKSGRVGEITGSNTPTPGGDHKKLCRA